MTIFKRRRGGQESGIWYGRFVDCAGVRRQIPLLKERRTSEQMLASIERLRDFRQARRALDASLLDFVEGLPGAIRGKLAEWNLLDRAQAGARELWRQEHNSFAGLLAKTRDDRLRAHYSKLLGVAGRLAALLELIEQTAAPFVGVESVRRAWALVRWFAQEARRVYGVTFGGDDMGRRIVEFVRKNPGCRASALSGGGVRNLTKAARDDILPDLIDAGLVVRRGRALYALTVEGCGLN